MKKENLKLLEILFEAGITTEAEIQKIGLSEIIKLGKLSFKQLLLLDQLQQAVKCGKILSWLSGSWVPENHKSKAPAAAISEDVSEEKIPAENLI